MINKAKHLLRKIKTKLSNSTYTRYHHNDDSKLYTDNDYCLNFLQEQTKKKNIFHGYWHGQINRKHIFSIKSILTTQPNSEVWLWIDENTWEQNTEVIQQLNSYKNIKVLKYDGVLERKGTIYENVPLNHFTQTENLPFRADAFRILILHKYGGIYFDLDIMFLRDISNFLDREFIYCWEKQPYGNNAIIHLNKQDTLLQLHKIVKENNSFQPWFIFNYANKLKNVWTFPTAYFDPLWLFNPEDKADISNQKGSYTYPITNWDEFFQKKISEETKYNNFFEGCYAFHWHNRWGIEVVENSYFDMFDKQFSKLLNWDI